MNQPVTVITGATGFLGKAVLDRLLSAGHRCHAISRNPTRARNHLPASVTTAGWSDPLPTTTRHVINLAGDSIASIWTTRKRHRILHSRTSTLATLAAKIRSLPEPPLSLVSASAVGFYGDRPGETLTESSPPDPNRRFRFEVCNAWEHAAQAAVAGLPTRLVTLRYGNILDPSGGLLAAFSKIFRLTRTISHLGSPNSFKPWISLHDAAALTVFATANPCLMNQVNATSPTPAVSSDFYLHIARFLEIQRQVLVHPRLARLALGELAQAFAEDQRILPTRALASGFDFAHPTLDTCFASLQSPANP
ncbi:MAG: DUF1731 domain-containing protein [Verrucomicrobiales bacterium]|nr:DUF1731 domain-containing protein [Verrucomicrobiales bacterium]